ncbi:MAG TPA: hypothetical protein VHY22_10430, partial [Chthoniobacteraceae bacterium]|nr:hypothetical protein [Chthoniobacteraceae bacterium]
LIARDPKLALAALSLRSNHAARHSATSPAPQQCRSGSTGDYFNRLLGPGCYPRKPGILLFPYRNRLCLAGEDVWGAFPAMESIPEDAGNRN